MKDMARRRRGTFLGFNLVDWAIATFAGLCLAGGAYLFVVGIFTIGGRP